MPLEKACQDGRHDSLQDLIQSQAFPEPIYVMRPTMPDLELYCKKLEGVWQRKWLTNKGPLHDELESRLCNYLGVEQLSLFCNGTLALLLALQALEIDGGEVITTSFTFPATAHVLHWNRTQPVFCDIQPGTFNLNPECVEELITPATRAIVPVHVFGNPCDVEALRDIADKHGLRLIYDAAHAFGVRLKGRSLLRWGDMSALSLHATKLFSTAEGGAVVAGTATLKKRIDFLKDFGIADEETVIGPGINGKMTELQAAYGLLALENVGREIANRRACALAYRERLASVLGLTFLDDLPGVESNYSHFPILVDADAYGMGRDDLHETLKRFNVHTRKYFYPLCSRFPCYSEHPSAHPRRLPVAERVAAQVLCLPIYGSLGVDAVDAICTILEEIGRRSRD